MTKYTKRTYNKEIAANEAALDAVEANLQAFNTLHNSQGKLSDAKEGFEKSLRIARTVRALEFIPQLHAWLALVSIQRAEHQEACEYWNHVLDIDTADFRGAQELYHLEWLQAYMNPDRDVGQSRLLNATEEARDLDRSSYLKLKWLSGTLFGPEPSSESALRKELMDSEMGWFAYFSRRWKRSAVGLRLI